VFFRNTVDVTDPGKRHRARCSNSRESNTNVAVVPNLMRNPASYKPVANPRPIDIIVIHHISATGWLNADFQGRFTDELRSFEQESGVERPEGVREDGDGAFIDRIKFDPRFCKRILELYAVSAHYMIDRDGTIHQLVDDNDIAYHAGASVMPDGTGNVNSRSIGIELISSHPSADPSVASGAIPAYTVEQYESLTGLLADLMLRYGIDDVDQIVGHDEIAGEEAVKRGIRSQPKTDPGPAFDWRRIDRYAETLIRADPWLGSPVE